MAWNPSQDCLALIKESEGLHRKLPSGKIEAYPDPVGVWTIGYGSIFHVDADRPVKKGDVIAKADAERWLEVEVDEKADAVNTLCKVNLTQGMFDALVSFAYNVGTGDRGLKGSTLLKKLNSIRIAHIRDLMPAVEFLRWRLQTILLASSSRRFFLGPLVNAIARLYGAERRETIWRRTADRLL